MTQFPNNSQDDDVLFDRLVDGELSHSERQQLLASLDNRQDGWRRCALAFLESQTWDGELKSLLTEPEEQLATPSRSNSHNPANKQLGKWLAVAASLLIAFSLGWLTNQNPNTSEQSEQFANTQQPEIEISPLGELPQFKSDDAVTLLVQDIQGNNQRLQVPLMEVDQIDNQLSSTLPAELRNRLRNSGFDLQRRRRFAPMYFEQDEQLVPMVVPVDDTYVVPIDRPVY